ncbi:plastocyanin/azurin family copper-binding protein [Patescibacteria group bacterium]
MDTKTKIHTIISLVLVAAITGLAIWAQTPSSDLKADILSTDTVLVRIQDFAFDPDVVRIDADTTVSWLHDETEEFGEVEHVISSFDPDDASQGGVEFESETLYLGDTFSRTFSTEGVYNYQCGLHPFMTGKICVGEESELIDEDCAVELTDLDEPALGEDDLDAAADEDFADEDILADDDDDDDDDALALDDEDAVDLLLEEDEDTDVSLFDAADEEFESDTLNFNGEEFVFVQPEANADDATTAEGSELADSGPEHMIYLLLLAVAFYGAKKLSPKKR